MADKETYEAQAASVKHVLETYGKELGAAHQKHLGCAYRNLEALAELRRSLIASAADDQEHCSDALAEQIIALLHIPAKM